MLALLIAALLGPLPLVSSAAGGEHAPRFVRLVLAVDAYGVAGRGELVVDRERGRFVRRFVAGPASEAEGFDGQRAWRADATGFGRVQGNRARVAAIRCWAALLSGAAQAGAPRSGALEIVRSGAGGLVERAVLHDGSVRDALRLEDYRSAGGLVVPFALRDAISDSGTWSARVLRVETPADIAPATFAPPPAPPDATLRGTTTVPMGFALGIPVIPVRIGNGPPLRMVLDTGGQNVIDPRVARQLGLQVVGNAIVGGAGEGVAAIRFTRVERMRIGTAELRHQPFTVLDLGGVAPGIDGIVGYEVLARFAARLDYRRQRLSLSPSGAALGAGAARIPFVYDDRQPQIAGRADGLPVPVTIDTGSTSGLDFTAPFVRAKHLLRRYPRHVSGASFVGVGGSLRSSLARVRVLRLGPVRDDDVIASLPQAATAGAFAEASIGANLGESVLSRHVVVFDYPTQTMALGPGGLPAKPWSDRAGISLRARPDGLLVVRVLAPTPASRAGIVRGMRLIALDGRPVTGADRKRVLRVLAGPPGTRVRLRFAGGRSATLRLAEYL